MLRAAERREGADQDQSRGGDDARRVLQAAGDGLLVVAGPRNRSRDAREHEHLVVGRETEENDEEQRGGDDE